MTDAEKSRRFKAALASLMIDVFGGGIFIGLIIAAFMYMALAPTCQITPKGNEPQYERYEQ